MTAAPPRQAPAAADPFGARGPKLAALLGIAADARVLVAGTLPDGWRGAGYALVGYAAVLGLIWGCLTLTTVPAG